MHACTAQNSPFGKMSNLDWRDELYQNWLAITYIHFPLLIKKRVMEGAVKLGMAVNSRLLATCSRGRQDISRPNVRHHSYRSVLHLLLVEHVWNTSPGWHPEAIWDRCPWLVLLSPSLPLSQPCPPCLSISNPPRQESSQPSVFVLFNVSPFFLLLLFLLRYRVPKSYLQVSYVLIDVHQGSDTVVWYVFKVSRMWLVVNTIDAVYGNFLIPPRNISKRGQRYWEIRHLKWSYSICIKTKSTTSAIQSKV